MSLKWGEEEFKGFSKSVKKVEETNECAWWTLFGIIIIMEVLFLLKIFGKI